MTATQPGSDRAAGAAAAAEVAFITELWTLYAVGLSATMLRTYARVRAVGVRGLRADDYFVWVGILFYTAQSALGHEVGHAANGSANNGMSETQRESLDPNSDEYMKRVLGSKIQVAGWSTYVCLMTSLKISMLFFLTRLMFGLGRSFQLRICIGFILVITTFITCLVSIFAFCRPFRNYWAIYPDPGRSCQAAISLPIVWSTFATNVSTDIYLIMIPIPILWQSSLALSKKIASTVVLGAGIFVLVCAVLKSAFILADPINGAQLAGSWGTREAFVAVMTTNLPMIFPLIKRWLRPLLPKQLSASPKVEKSPEGFRTIGGGGPGAEARRRPASANALTGLSCSASEELVADETKKEQEQEDILHPGEITDIEAGASSRRPSLVPGSDDAEQKAWTQLEHDSRK
ncbi:triacylglycerol lipase [Cordyceps militaris]|uniref:Triacylglycerol lipase n=1 Tax=Cordyceps militaris TaxID=73501 RepID=A0A2H4SSK3_CORMI|nr:triacylglycerol lipase [Cordyceps militaris]